MIKEINVFSTVKKPIQYGRQMLGHANISPHIPTQKSTGSGGEGVWSLWIGFPDQIRWYFQMPRTDRRRQHSRSRSRSSGGYREKRRRIEIEDNGVTRDKSIDTRWVSFIPCYFFDKLLWEICSNFCCLERQSKISVRFSFRKGEFLRALGTFLIKDLFWGMKFYVELRVVQGN